MLKPLFRLFGGLSWLFRIRIWRFKPPTAAVSTAKKPRLNRQKIQPWRVSTTNLNRWTAALFSTAAVPSLVNFNRFKDPPFFGNQRQEPDKDGHVLSTFVLLCVLLYYDQFHKNWCLYFCTQWIFTTYSFTLWKCTCHVLLNNFWMFFDGAYPFYYKIFKKILRKSPKTGFCRSKNPIL